MTFTQAMQALLDGHKVRCDEWDKFEYVFLNKHGVLENQREMETYISVFEMRLKWEIYQTPKDPREWTVWYHKDMNAFCTIDPGQTAEVWEKIIIREIL